MGSSLFKLSRKRTLALAIGLGAIGGPLATAPASLAATQQPAAGINCQADGKINGAGSTFQTNAINDAFTFGYQQDVCGPQTSVSGLFQGGTFTSNNGSGGTFTNTASSWGTTDPAGFSFTVGSTTNNVSGMVAYNYSLGGTATTNGSGAGLNRISCRIDMFGGTDLPYNTAQLTALKGTPGAVTAGTNAPWNASPYKCDTYTSNTTYSDGGTAFTGITNVDKAAPPYGPQSYGSWPATGDTNASPMGLPIAAGAVAFVANMNGVCTTQPSGVQLNLTPAETDGIWEGTINQWNDAVLDANNSWLVSDNCTGNIQRVVRFDNSGTTAITMFTLNGYNTNSTLCAAGSKGVNEAWYTSGIASNNTGFWPEGCTDSNNAQGTSTPLGTTAPNETSAGSNGSPSLISKVESTNGGIGYAELGLWGTIPAGDVYAALATPATQSSGSPTYILPGNPGASSNCQLPTSVPTGNNSTAAVGLSGNGWTNTGTPTAPGKQDIADPSGGTGYPACGLTFDLVYTGENENNEVAAPAGSNVTPTAGCTIAAPATQTTSVDNPSGSTSILVPSTAGYPATGTITANGTNLVYTSITGGSFVLSAATSADVPSGSTVTLASTKAAQTSSAPGVNGACLTTGDSVSGITNDQLRTLYSYFTYLYSPLGQDQTGTQTGQGATNKNLQNQTLDPLPAQWLPYLESGFQASF